MILFAIYLLLSSSLSILPNFLNPPSRSHARRTTLEVHQRHRRENELLSLSSSNATYVHAHSINGTNACDERDTTMWTRRARGNDWSPIERRRSSTWPRLPPPLAARAASRPADARTTPPAHPVPRRYPRTTVSYLWLFATTPTLPLSLRLFNPFATPWRSSVIDAVFKNPVLFSGEEGEFFVNTSIRN